MGSIIIIAHDISIHAPPRGATGEPCAAAGRGAISIHAPPRGATLARMAGFQRRWYFNSRPSARGDKMLRNRMNWNIISIHAPPRGATPPAAARSRGQNFNSRPSARGDRSCASSSSAHMHFNSRPSARGDMRSAGFIRSHTMISIHAPPRGATT